MITPLSEALAERGYDTLTPVQEAVSAPEIVEKDLLVSAQTGSGKTVGFGIAIAPTLLGDQDRFDRAATPLALVVAPTRELAFQVMRELKWLYEKTGAIVTSCVGGMDMRNERRALERGAHIVVGTPGRLRDHIERGSLDLSDVRAVVLDEADEMLDLGFREDLEFMLGEAPEDRRTLLFSATVPPMIAKLAQQFQNDALRISTIGKAEQHADISYQALRVAQSDTENAIFNLLRYHGDETAIIFANTRASVNHLTARLSNRGLSTVSLSGELSQTERSHALQAMRDGRAKVCVATDVAARGIDLPNLTLVIHAELPTNQETLLHRSGRTGRAGRKGISALIVPPKATKKAERLLKWAKLTADWGRAPSAEEIKAKDEERLLADPVWSEAVSEDEATFAAKLLEQHSAETIAAAYLRLYQSRHAAPEELSAPEERPERKPREIKDFGPSRWFSLSVGRDERAEPRWLLPLICRAGNIDKTAIGAIRVQDNETFLELSEPKVQGFIDALDNGVLEDNIKATLLNAAPSLPKPAPRKGGKFGDRPGGKPGGKFGGSRDDKFGGRRDDRFGAEKFDRPKPHSKGSGDGYDRKRKPRKPHASEMGDPNVEAKPVKSKPAGKSTDKPAGKPASKHRPGASNPGVKLAGRLSGKPGGQPNGKPAGKFGGKPGGKSGGRPSGKPHKAGAGFDAARRPKR